MKQRSIESMKELPKFKSEEEERKFWEPADSTKHIDWSRENARSSLS